MDTIAFLSIVRMLVACRMAYSSSDKAKEQPEGTVSGRASKKVLGGSLISVGVSRIDDIADLSLVRIAAERESQHYGAQWD